MSGHVAGRPFAYNGNAFPQGTHSSGITKRELVAAMVLQGIVANTSIVAYDARATEESGNKHLRVCAQAAIAMADTLLAELAK